MTPPKLASCAAECAVRQLIGRYCRALDRLDLPLLESLFWPEATIDMGVFYKGPPHGFVKVAIDFMTRMRATRHEISTVVATGSDEEAAAETYVRAWHVMETPQGLTELAVLARYLNRFSRRGGEWRIAHHGEVVDWGEERAASSAWLDGAVGLPSGERTAADPSYRLFG